MRNFEKYIYRVIKISVNNYYNHKYITHISDISNGIPIVPIENAKLRRVVKANQDIQHVDIDFRSTVKELKGIIHKPVEVNVNTEIMKQTYCDKDKEEIIHSCGHSNLNCHLCDGQFLFYVHC